jgi:hypothetical protein
MTTQNAQNVSSLLSWRNVILAKLRECSFSESCDSKPVVPWGHLLIINTQMPQLCPFFLRREIILHRTWLKFR